jgi:hypothetical protein
MRNRQVLGKHRTTKANDGQKYSQNPNPMAKRHGFPPYTNSPGEYTPPGVPKKRAMIHELSPYAQRSVALRFDRKKLEILLWSARSICGKLPFTMTADQEDQIPLPPAPPRSLLAPVLWLVLLQVASAVLWSRPSEMMALVADDPRWQWAGHLGLAGLVLFLWLDFDRRAFLGLRRRLETACGSLGAALFLGSLVLPQRLVDNNSGFIHVPMEHPLFVTFLELDLARALATGWFWFRLLASESATATAAVREGAEKPGNPEAGRTSTQETVTHGLGGVVVSRAWWARRTWQRGGLVIAFGVAVAFQLGHLECLPHVDDEVIQHWQARLYATGRWQAPPIPSPSSFTGNVKLTPGNDRLFSSFLPGFALPLVPFVFLGVEWVLNPSLALLLVLLWHRLVRRTNGQDIGNLSFWLLALSPFLLIMAAGRMNHVLALLLVVGVLVCLVESVRGKAPLWSLMAGLLVGWLLMTRRVDGGAVLLAAVTSLLTQRKAWSHRLGNVAMLVLGAALITWGQMIMTAWHTGDALLGGRFVAQAAMETLDFPWFEWFANSFDNVTGFNLYAFGGLLAGWAGFGLLASRDSGPSDGNSEESRILERFLVWHAVLLLMVYGVYRYQDFCYGPRFLFCLLPAASLGVARLLARFNMAGLLSWPMVSRVLVMQLALAFFLTQQIGWAALARSWWHIDGAFERWAAQEFGETPVVLFLKSPTRSRLELVRRLIASGFPSSVVLALAAIEGLDTEGLLAAIRRFDHAHPGASRADLEALVDRLAITSGENDPRRFDINPVETIRLNEPELAKRSRVVAVDLGDEPNTAVCAHFPGRQAWLVWRQGDRFHRALLGPAGVPDFR